MTTVAPPTLLVGELRAIVDHLHPCTFGASIHANLDRTGSRLASCELWTGGFDALWHLHAELPAAVGHTTLDLERSLVTIGYIYALTPGGRAKWRHDPKRGEIRWLDITRPW